MGNMARLSPALCNSGKLVQSASWYTRPTLAVHSASSEKSQGTHGPGDCSRIQVLLLSTILVEERDRVPCGDPERTAFEGEMSEEINHWQWVWVSHMKIIQEP